MIAQKARTYHERLDCRASAAPRSPTLRRRNRRGGRAALRHNTPTTIGTPDNPNGRRVSYTSRSAATSREDRRARQRAKPLRTEARGAYRDADPTENRDPSGGRRRTRQPAEACSGTTGGRPARPSHQDRRRAPTYPVMSARPAIGKRATRRGGGTADAKGAQLLSTSHISRDAAEGPSVLSLFTPFSPS